MTSENEKKDESESLASGFRGTLERLEKVSEERIAELKRELVELDKRLKKASIWGKNDLLFRQRLAYAEISSIQDGMISRQQTYLLALRFDMLHNEIRKNPEDSALDEKIEKAEKKLDEHLSKRLGQLFDPSGHGAMYGA